MLTIEFLFCTIHIALGAAYSIAFTFVVQLFALAHAHFYLYATVLEVQRQGNQRVTVQLNGLTQLQDLSFVHQQLTVTNRVGVESVALIIGGDMHPVQEQLSVFHGAEGVLHIHFACAQTLDFGALQLDACFVAIQNIVVMEGFAIGRDFFFAFCSG